MEENNKSFEELMVEKIDNGEKLTEKEIGVLVWGYEIFSKEGDIGRWTQNIFTVVSLCGRNFGINWATGLTEYQENEFYSQPYEVEKHEYEKTITVTRWVKVEK